MNSIAGLYVLTVCSIASGECSNTFFELPSNETCTSLASREASQDVLNMRIEFAREGTLFFTRGCKDREEK